MNTTCSHGDLDHIAYDQLTQTILHKTAGGLGVGRLGYNYLKLHQYTCSLIKVPSWGFLYFKKKKKSYIKSSNSIQLHTNMYDLVRQCFLFVVYVEFGFLDKHVFRRPELSLFSP